MKKLILLGNLLVGLHSLYAQNQLEVKSPSHYVSINKNAVFEPIPTTSKGRKEALLIGNTTYMYGNKLGENPINDVQDLANKLKNLGFNVVVDTNATLATIKQDVRAFQERIKGAEIAAFFYAGHGMEIGGKKYIIPIDAQLKSPIDADDDAYNIETLFSRLRNAGAKHNLIILDACRDDPFKKKDDASHRAWGDNTSRGFTPIELNKIPEGNVYLAMATGWGLKAANGEGRNGTYTSSLLKNLQPGIRLERVFDKAAIDVKKQTQNTQNPQFVKEVSLDEEFVF